MNWSVLMTLGFVGICLGLFYVFLVWNFDYWKKREIKGPKSIALYGSLPSLVSQKRNVAYDLQEIYKQYREDENFVGLYSIRTPQLMILDPTLAHNIYVKDFKYFSDNEFSTWFDESNSRMFSKSPFILRGEKWKASRHEIAPGFTPTRIKSIYPVTQLVCERMVKFIREKCIDVDSNGVNANDLSLRYTSEVVSDCVLGVKADSFTDNPSPILQMAKNLFQNSTTFMIYTFLAGLWPAMRKFYKAKFLKKETEDFFTDLLNAAFNMRRKQNVDRVDFLNFILQLQDKANLSNKQTASHAMTFVVEGFESSAALIAHSLYQLGKYPDVQQKLLDEILANTNEKCELDFDKLNDMSYLDQCIHETIRITSLPYSTKLCTKPCELINKNGTKIQMKRDDIVLIPIYCFHSDERFYPNPNEFIPERFSPENGGIKKFRDMGVFYPFGDGPRICLGMRFALAQVKTAVVEIVKNFNIILNPKTRTDNRLGATNIIPTLDGGVWVNFEERK